MSVIVRGMEMPNNCKSCPLRYSSTGYAWCDITGASLALEIDMRDYTCPLVDIPTPHGRLIDADVLKQSAHLNGQLKTYIDTWIDSHETVIEAEGSET